MPKIPLYAYTPTASESPNVRANPNMLDGQYAAAQRLGDAVAGIGERAFDFAAKKQTAVNNATLADVDRQLKEGFLLFQDELKRNPNEKTWEPAWQKRAKEIEDTVMKGVEAPALKQRVKGELENWKAMTSLQVRSVATEREIKRARAMVLDSADADLKLGDVESYRAKIKQGAADGLFDPDEATEFLRDGERKAARYEAYALINENPALAIESLDDRTEGGRYRAFTALDEQDRYQLKQSAQGALDFRRRRVGEMLNERAVAGEVITKEELDALVASKDITATWAKAFHKTQLKDLGGGGSLFDAQEDFYRLRVAVSEFDPKAPGAMKRETEIFTQAMLLPAEMKNDVLTRLKDKGKPESVNNSAVAREAFGLVDDAFKAGLYGAFEVEQYTPQGKKKVVDQKVYAEAVKQKAQIQDDVSDFLKKKPNATRSEVVEEVTRLNQSFIDSDLRRMAAGQRDPATLLIRAKGEDKALESRMLFLIDQYATGTSTTK